MNVFIVGIGGKMGKALCAQANEFGIKVAGGLDKTEVDGYKVYSSAADVDVEFDAVIDFSRPATLDSVIELCTKHKKPCVIATTGYSDAQEAQIAALAQKVAVFKSANMSLGVNALSILAEKAAAILKDFDIEIVEKHHNQKQDAPSGTAKLLCESIERGLDYTPAYVYGRSGNAPRAKQEIGVHAVRGGSVVGEHEVGFYGADESVVLSHSALSRKIFADGALKAALWISGRKAGLYGMRDMLGM